MVSVVGAAAVTGGIISFTGHYWGWLFGGPFMSAIGAGLLYTVGSSYPAAYTAIGIDRLLDVNTSAVRLIGYQILYGVGIGCAIQVGIYIFNISFLNLYAPR